MSLQVDPLEAYYDEKEDVDDPLASYYEEKPKYRDVVSEELRSKGYEPEFSEELERAGEYGRKETTKGIISGASLGFSEKIPGFKTDDTIGSKGGEIIGSTLPITGLSKIFNNPLTRIASKSPILQKQLSSLAHLTGSFLSGGTYGAATEAIKKEELPSSETFLEHGATWAVLDGALQAAGASGRFAKALLSKSKKVKKPEWKVINETINEMRKDGVDFTNPERVQAKALSLLEEGAQNNTSNVGRSESKALSERKVEQKFFDKLESQSIPEPYFPREFEAIEVIDNVANEQVQASMEALSPRVSTQKQLGENIKEGVGSAMKAAEAEYAPAYQLAEEAAANTKTLVPQNTAKVATETLKAIQGLKTKPEGYNQVTKALENTLEDAGFVINKDPSGQVDFAVSNQEVYPNKLMELARRLNKIIKYDSIDKSVQDRLKPVVQAIKKDIKTGLQETPGAVEMFEAAERDFGKSATKFGKDSIRRIRKLEEGEKVAKLIRNPSTLADLKEILPEDRFKEVERELLEHMQSQNEDKARAFYREIRPSLNPEAQAIGEEILESKIPRSDPSRKEALRSKTKEVVLNDLSKASVIGERPEAALKLWKTKEGQQLIKESLKDNPNKKEVIDYLSNQSLKDMSSSIISPQGSINFKKLNEFLKDPASINNLKLVGGEEGVQFLKQLETLSNRAEKNLSIMEGRIGKGGAKARAEVEDALERKGKERFRKIKEKEESKSKDSLFYKMDDFLKDYGIKTKGLLGLIGIAKFGIPGVIETAAAYELIRRLIKSKPLQKAIRQAAGPRTDPKYIVGAYEAINKAIQD